MFTEGQKPGVSLIIPNLRNDAQFLERFFSSFCQVNTYAPLELIIASNETCESRGEKIEQYAPYLDIKEYTCSGEKCTTPSLKNLAAQKASYDYLLFASLSVVFTEDLISLMMGQLLDSAIGVVGVGLQELNSTGAPGRQRVLQKAGVSFYWNEELKLHKPYRLLIEKDRFFSQDVPNTICPAVNGELILCRKEDFDLIGGFSEDYYLRVDDVDFCMKMNAQLHKKALCINELSLSHQPTENMDKDRAGKPVTQEYLCRDLKKLNKKFKELLVKHFLAVESLHFNTFLNEKYTGAMMLPFKRERFVGNRENWFRAGKWKELLDKGPNQTFELPQLAGLSRVGWLQPHLNMAGGIRRAIEMSNRLVEWGAQFFIITPDGHKANWLPMQAEVISFEEALRLNFEVLIVSDPECIDMFNALKKKCGLFFHLHAYMLYRQANEKLRRYYDICKDYTNISNSRWTAEHVESYCGVASAEIIPGGVNKEQFHPYISEKIFDTCFFGARKRKIKATSELINALSGFSRMPLVDYDLSQELLAPAISAARVFVSGSYYEGFNLCPLEAMACGVPVAMTDCGGSREYAVNQENALVVSNQDYAALRREVKRLLGDHDLRCHLIEKGMETAWCYSWEKVSLQLAGVLVGLKGGSELPGQF